MAKKRKAWIHVGVPGAGDVLESALAHHHGALVELGVEPIAHTTSESFCVAVEILRTHKDWGMKRSDVEGRWTRLVHRAGGARCDLVLSQPMLAGATRDQADLLADALHGYQVHVVLTTGGYDEALAAAVDAWGFAVRKPERLHVLEVEGASPKAVWRSFGALVGFGTSSLPIDGVPAIGGSCDSLAEAHREIERLARRNASLEVRLEEVDRKRRKLKRRLRKTDQAA
ncbi:MAG: hypothetical protein FWE71_17145 [Nocardioidaceae bacterium]|nr:hypothetical protein [Nocardioidaceae bacterium]MCL2612972.1 hypothetical protein [Nocardioidaceae bacterium]